MTISEVAKNALKVILKESNFDFEKLTENPEAAAADYKAILTAVEQKKYTHELKQALVKIATKSIHEKADTVLILAEAGSLKGTPLEPIAAMLKKATQYQRPWQIDISYNKVMSELMPDEGGLPAFIQKEKHYFAEVFERGVGNIADAENDQWILGHYKDYVPSVRDEHFYNVLKALSSLEDDYKAAIETYRKTAQNARGINTQFAAEKVLTAILEQNKHRYLKEIAPELIAAAEKTFQRISHELATPSPTSDYSRDLPAYDSMHPPQKEDESVAPDPKKLSGDRDARYPGKASRFELAGTNEDPPEDTTVVDRAIRDILEGGRDGRPRRRGNEGNRPRRR